MTRGHRIAELLRQLIDEDVAALAGRVDRAWSAGVEADPSAVVLGRYELVRVLGRGSYGVVFQGFDPILDRDVAIKVAHARGSFDAVAHEARMLARVRHPHVVAVYDAQRVGRYDLLVMQLVEGETMRRVASRLDARELLECYLQVAEGLAAAHRIGAVHGDVKPANILVDLERRVYLADFGQSRLVGLDEPRAPRFRGTRVYLAPEVLAGTSYTPLADQYALCVSIWESLFGCHPDRGPKNLDALSKPHARVAGVLERGLAPAPASRFPDVEALADELRTAVGLDESRRAS